MHTPDQNETSSSPEAEPLAPGLYVVATPIGNLEDITLRALRVLREVDLIACEDTRHTQKLLNHFEIKTPTQSYHQHNEAARAKELVERVATGERIALVSDAGTPGISDPGEKLIGIALERGLKVIVIPGPSALISGLVASGLPTDSFHFVGFLPSRSGERRSALEALRGVCETLVFYEAPHRIMETLADIGTILGRRRRIAVARELTKLHEEFLRGTVDDIAAELRKHATIKGELTIIVSGRTEEQRIGESSGSLAERMRQLIFVEKMDQKDALKQAAREFGLSKSEAYREWQREKGRKRAIGN